MVDEKKDATKLTADKNPEDISMVKEETISKLEAGLKAVYSTPDEPAEESETETTEKLAEKKDDSTPAKVDKVEGDTTPEKKAEDSEIQFPDAHYRAMIHQGWTADEIKDLVETNPDKALALGKKMYDTTNQLSDQFAAVGRKPTVVSAVPVKSNVQFKGLDVKKIAESLGIEEESARGLAGEINTLLQGQHEELSRVQDMLKEAETKRSAPDLTPEDRQLEKEVDQFFGDKEFLSMYGDFYGTDDNLDNLTHIQAKRRVEVLERADDILAGSILSNRKMSIQEALGSAHLRVSRDIAESIMRKGIKASLQKREKSMTLKPVSAASGDIKPKTPKEREKVLEAKVGERIKSISW